MKINKEISLTEAKAIDCQEKECEQVAEAVVDENLEEAIDLSNIDLATMDRADLIALIRDNAEPEVEDEEEQDELDDVLQDVVEDTYEAADLIDTIDGVSIIPGTIEAVLQKALSTAVTQKRNGYDKDYPNVLLSGLAGFGKTGAVKAFCEQHHLNFFPLDASSLDMATVSGIPYPERDKNGVLKQRPVASGFWDRIFLPNTVVFLDEYNRARPDIAGTLLKLVNEHNLPLSVKNKKTGQVSSMKHLPNILFSVLAINPASDVFSDVSVEMTPEKISRNGLLHDIEPNTQELKKYLDKVYDAILANPFLPQKDLDMYTGQKNIYTALLTNSSFTFDLEDEVRAIHNQNQETGRYTNFLNYRTFTINLQLCETGTKAEYLQNLSLTKFSADKQNMIKNILRSYSDKPTKANTVFNKAQQQAAAAATAQQQTAASNATRSKLGAFANSL